MENNAPVDVAKLSENRTKTSIKINHLGVYSGIIFSGLLGPKPQVH